VLDRMSIGYEPVTKEMGKHEGKEVRFLKEIKLYEWSIVTFPANESAAVTGVKALEDLDRLFHDFKAGRITAQQLADACLKASPEPAPLDAPADQPLALDPDTSDSVTWQEVKACSVTTRPTFAGPRKAGRGNPMSDEDIKSLRGRAHVRGVQVRERGPDHRDQGAGPEAPRPRPSSPRWTPRSTRPRRRSRTSRRPPSGPR
jgi:hypothetical protein